MPMSNGRRSGKWTGRRPMHLEILTGKKKQQQSANGNGSRFKWGKRRNSTTSSCNESPSVVVMSCSTATSSATTPMRLDHEGSIQSMFDGVISSPLSMHAAEPLHQHTEQPHWSVDEEGDVDMDSKCVASAEWGYRSNSSTGSAYEMAGDQGKTLQRQWVDILHLSDILTTVFYFMDRRELLTTVRLVSTHWNDTCSNCTLLWHHHTFKDNPYYYESVLSEIPATPPNEDDMVDEVDEEQQEQDKEQQTRRIQVAQDSQLYPARKTMWHDRGDSFAMRRRNLQGMWSFLNYKEYFIEQCLLDRCSTMETPSRGRNDRGAGSTEQREQGSGADDTARSCSKPKNHRSKLGPMFLEDKYTMSCMERAVPSATYRHSLTVLPTSSENADNAGYADRTPVDAKNTSDKVYLIGGLHNTMAIQPPELAEDFVNVLDVSQDSTQPLTSTSAPRIPSNSGSQSSSSSPVNPSQSVSSPLAQSLRKLLDFGNTCSRYGNSRRSSISIPRKPGQFKRVKVVGKPPHIGKHTSVMFEDMEINDQRGPKILIFGGVENDQVTNKLYHYDLNTDTWFLEQFEHSENVPSPRTNHTAVAVGEYMYVVGGGIGPNMVPTSEIWRYHVHDHIWDQVHFTGDIEEFTPRLGTVAAVVNHKIMIYGGGYWHQTSMNDRGWREKYCDMFFLDTDTSVITKILQGSSSLAPDVGTFPTSALIGTQWYIIGGAFENKISCNIHSFDTVTYRWRKFDQSFYGGDSLSCCHFVNNDHLNKLLILGGYCYTPLSKFQIFSLRYKDMMDAKQLYPISTFHFHGREQLSQW